MRYLRTVASFEAQVRFAQDLTPVVAKSFVPFEMIEQWADWVPTSGTGYENVDLEWHAAPEFSRDEQAAILQFHSVWNDVADELNRLEASTGGLNGVECLKGEPFWQAFGAAASRALGVFERRGELTALAKLDET